MAGKLNKTAFKSLQEMLPLLSAEQLAEVSQRVRLLQSMSSTAAAVPVVTERVDWLLEGILREIERRGLATDTLRKLNIASLAPSYGAQGESVRRHLLERAGKSLSSVERMALGRAVARALTAYLGREEYGVPVIALKKMLHQVPRIPEAIEASYPGYQQAAVLSFLCREKNT